MPAYSKQHMQQQLRQSLVRSWRFAGGGRLCAREALSMLHAAMTFSSMVQWSWRDLGYVHTIAQVPAAKTCCGLQFTCSLCCAMLQLEPWYGCRLLGASPSTVHDPVADYWKVFGRLTSVNFLLLADYSLLLFY